MSIPEKNEIKRSFECVSAAGTVKQQNHKVEAKVLLSPYLTIRKEDRMADQEIFDKILEVAKQAMPELDTEHVTMDTVINRDMGADSLAFIMIICKIEGAFDIEIPDETWEHLSTMRDLVDTVKKLQETK